jgi:hypothetical protein
LVVRNDHVEVCLHVVSRYHTLLFMLPSIFHSWCFDVPRKLITIEKRLLYSGYCRDNQTHHSCNRLLLEIAVHATNQVAPTFSKDNENLHTKFFLRQPAKLY